MCSPRQAQYIQYGSIAIPMYIIRTCIGTYYSIDTSAATVSISFSKRLRLASRHLLRGSNGNKKTKSFAACKRISYQRVL